MIKIENVEIDGMRAAVRGMRNPLESWAKMDGAQCCYIDDCADCRFVSDSVACACANSNTYIAGPADVKLMRQLAAAGTDHAKFMRFITVSCDILAPLYWWKEYDTYKVGTVANSCSTMHKIHAKRFTRDDFSCEHMGGEATVVLDIIISNLNNFRTRYSAHTMTGDTESAKRCWWNMIQLLPASYNQRRTVLLNYQVLRAMYHARRNHKLDEWRDFCRWCETLPYSELITGGRNNAV